MHILGSPSTLTSLPFSRIWFFSFSAGRVSHTLLHPRRTLSGCVQQTSGEVDQVCEVDPSYGDLGGVNCRLRHQSFDLFRDKLCAPLQVNFSVNTEL